MQSRKVMIVEDEGLIANDVADQLSKIGYEVTAISSSGEEALSLLQNGPPPDLVLMDIRLKGRIDGIDTAARVRSEHDLPVIFLTSHADAETIARAKQAEPFGFLVKPFRQLNLCSTIEIALYKHQSERAMMQRETWLTTVLQSTADPTIVTDIDGRIQFLNASAGRLLNTALADTAGVPWIEAMPLFDRLSGKPADDLVSLAMQRTATLKLARGLVLRRQDGNQIEIEGEVSPSILRGSLAGAVITARDVSQRNEEELQVRQEQKMQAVERMAAGVAHDFNNLLTVILGHGTELASVLRNPQDQERIQAILHAAGAAAGMTVQLLTLSCKQLVRAEVFPVNDSVRRMSGIFETSLGPAIQLRTDLAGDTGKVRMSADNLDQVLTNLILNARDAMPAGGEIMVITSNLNRMGRSGSVDITEALVKISVKDGGVGIPPENQEHIFEPFFTTKPHSRGTGLGMGLAIVHGIVKEAGGQIAMRSIPGAGTTFDILLPRVDEVKRARIVGEPARAVTGLKTILLVEDQPQIRTLVRTYLKTKGFNLIEASDGQEALKAAELYEGRIDLLISDVLMPRMDGITLSRQLTALRPDLKVIFISGQPGEAIESLRDPGLNAGFLAKPFALSSLLEKVLEMAV